MMAERADLDRQLREGVAQQQGAGLAAFAVDLEGRDLAGKAGVRMMRAEIDAVEHAAVGRQQRFEPSEDAGEVIEGDKALGDLRPVGDADRQQAGLADAADRVAGARKKVTSSGTSAPCWPGSSLSTPSQSKNMAGRGCA